MAKFSIHAERKRAYQKAVETLEKTIVHQRQRHLAIGRWDFAVFGPAAQGAKAVLRVCLAEQMMIKKASVYLAAVGDPGQMGSEGMMSIEEMTGGDVSEELRGLEVYHVSPMRPITVLDRREGEDLGRMRDLALEEFSGRNIAVIETPDEAAWGISALRYLNECDEFFPDPVMSMIRSRMRGVPRDSRGPRGLML